MGQLLMPDVVVVERPLVESRSGPRVTAVAWLCALATTAVYLIGSSRSFDYDGSVTVARFIRTPSLFAPFTRQVVFNNQVAFSFLEHLVYLATGRASETMMRLLPIVCAAATVGLLVAVLARFAPLLVAVAGGVLLATNPLFVGAAREVRGYSLVCLCALASTSLLFSLLRQPTRSKSTLYVAFVAVGLATHFYMVLVIATHLVILARRRRLTLEWRQRLLAGTILGVCAYLGVLSAMAQTARARPRTVHLGFPIDLDRGPARQRRPSDDHAGGRRPHHPLAAPRSTGDASADHLASGGVGDPVADHRPL